MTELDMESLQFLIDISLCLMSYNSQCQDSIIYLGQETS